MTATSTMQQRSERAADKNAIRPFQVNVRDADLTELRRRIEATRWPDRETDASQGVQLATMQELARYWATEYDWRKVEARLNALPQFITEIDGLDIHFIHVRSKHEDALPLIVSHGWPGSVIEQLKIIDPLTNPTAHGGKASDAFHVVIPNMPGYGFSGKPTTTGWDTVRIARAWIALMKRLGYKRFVAQGGDWGGVVVDMMAVEGASGIDRHSHQHARRCSSRRVEGGRLRRPGAIRSIRRGKTEVRDAERLVCEGSGLRPPDGTPSTDALRNCGFTRRPGRLDDRPRPAELPGYLAPVCRWHALWRYHARRCPRQHHALLVDDHGDFLGTSLLGKQVAVFRTERRLHPGSRERVS